MKKQFYYSVHADKDQVQVQETDPELYELLSHLQISKTRGLLNHVSKSFMSLGGNRTRIFYGLKYNDYTNLSRLEAGRRIYVHGMKGIHDLKRSTPYFNFYVSEEQTLSGGGFFNYVFGTEYPTEYELRTREPEVIKDLLNTASESPEGQQSGVYINNKDRMMVCRIAEKLWSSQLNDSTGRLVILLPKEGIYDESVDLLKQLYLLLPQRIRLNMGFAIDCSFEDIKSLTEECDLPVHIFTMRVDNKASLEARRIELGLKYPIVYFDATNPEAEIYDETRLSLLIKLSRKLSSSSDAKMAYIEKKVLENGKKLVSFKNLEEIFDMMKMDNFFWWDRQDLETPEDVMVAYRDQKELMEDEELKREALYSFYIRMLPWKEYALCLNEIILNNEYPGREEILSFFADELCYGKILEASLKIEQKILADASEHERTVLEAQKLNYDEKIVSIRTTHETVLAKQQKELEEEKQKNIEWEEQYQKTIAEHQTALHEMQENHVREIQDERKKMNDAVMQATEEANSRCVLLQNENNKLKSEKTMAEQERKKILDAYDGLEKENSSLSRKVKSLAGSEAGMEIARLSEDVQGKEEKIKELQKQTRAEQSRAEKAKLCMIIAVAAAGVLLIATIVFGILTFKNIGTAKNLQRQITNDNDKVKELDEQMGEKEKELEELQKQLEEKDEELEKQQKLIEEKEEDLENLKRQTGVMDEDTENRETDNEEQENIGDDNAYTGIDFQENSSINSENGLSERNGTFQVSPEQGLNSNPGLTQ